MNKYIKMGFSIKDDGIFEFHYAPLSLERTLKEQGFEVVDKEIYYGDAYNSQYCTIQVKFNSADELRALFKILLGYNQQVIDDYKKERGLTW